MIARSRRRRLLGGVLGISVVGWALDLVVRDSGPAAVEASPTVNQTDEQAPPTSVAQRAQRVLDRLQAQSELAAGAHGGAPVQRDLFALVMQAWQTQQALEPLLGSPPEETAPEQIVEDRPFVDTHVLRGVVEGPAALALINDVIVSKGGVVDDYEVIDIKRDHVRLQGPDEFVTLVITGPCAASPPASPSKEPTANNGHTQINSLGSLVDYLKRRNK